MPFNRTNTKKIYKLLFDEQYIKSDFDTENDIGPITLSVFVVITRKKKKESYNCPLFTLLYQFTLNVIINY